jgi:hypothetical protein
MMKTHKDQTINAQNL